MDVMLHDSDEENEQQRGKPKQYKEKAGYLFGYGPHKKSV
jgi:hypothetical protein